MAQEQAKALVSAVDEGGREPIDLSRLRGLLRAAQAAEGAARASLAGEINAVLTRLREPGNESEEAQVLVTELDAHAFDKLVDARGVSARKSAVETLLSLGFPHALKVDPGDLEFARKAAVREAEHARRLALGLPAEGDGEDAATGEFQRRLKQTRSSATWLTVLTGLLLAVKALALFDDNSPWTGLLALLAVGLSAGSTTYLTKAMPPTSNQALPVVGLVFGALLALGMTPAVGWTAGVAGLGAFVALIILLAWQYEEPSANQ